MSNSNKKTVTISLPDRYTDLQIENKYNSMTQKLDVIQKRVTYTPKPFIFTIPVVAGNPSSFTPYFKEAFKNSSQFNPDLSTDEQIANWYQQFLAIDPRSAAAETRSMLEDLGLIKRLNPGETMKLDARIVQELKRHSSWPKEVEVIGEIVEEGDTTVEIVSVTSLNPNEIHSTVVESITPEPVKVNKGGRPKKISSEVIDDEENNSSDESNLTPSVGGAETNE